VIREIFGDIINVKDTRFSGTGVFKSTTNGGTSLNDGGSGIKRGAWLTFRASDDVPTGNENSPITASVRRWRRVA
jgi:hypothetical protein